MDIATGSLSLGAPLRSLPHPHDISRKHPKRAYYGLPSLITGGLPICRSLPNAAGAERAKQDVLVDERFGHHDPPQKTNGPGE